VDPELPAIEARKIAAYQPVSCCLLSEYTGQNHCEHAPIEFRRSPWRVRLRWTIEHTFAKTRARIGFAIAGYDPRGDDE
jgi:hypothetical protein